MDDYEFKKGSAFLRLLKNVRYEKYHLYIILTYTVTDKRKNKVIIVNVTSIKDDDYDPTYILKKGDHEEIDHDSYILYGEAEVIPVSTLESELRQGKIKPSKDFNAKKVKEIAKGLIKKSAKTPGFVRNFYNKYFRYSESRDRFMYTRIKEEEWKKKSIWEIDMGKNFEWKRDIWD